MSGFAGWPPAAIEWFDGLAEDNSRAYFTRTKPRYETAVKGPMLALLDELEPEFGEARMFRPNRDTRFSTDKSPYRTSAAAFTGRMHSPGHYVQVSGAGLVAGGGVHGMSRDDLAAFRAAVADDATGPQVEALVATAERDGMSVGGETLKTAPRGFARDHPRARLLRFTNLILWREVPPSDLLHSRDALAWVHDVWTACDPLVRWLRAVLPPPDAASSRH